MVIDDLTINNYFITHLDIRTEGGFPRLVAQIVRLVNVELSTVGRPVFRNVKYGIAIVATRLEGRVNT